MTAEKKPSPSMVEAAQRRAEMVAFLNSREEPMRENQLAEHFPNWEGRTLHNTLKTLQDSELVYTSGGGSRGSPYYYSTKPIGGATTPKKRRYKRKPKDKAKAGAVTAVTLVEEKPARAVVVKNGNGAHHPADAGIELVLGGVTAVIGRNPETGRPRVIFQF